MLTSHGEGDRSPACAPPEATCALEPASPCPFKDGALCFCSFFLFSAGSFFLQLVPSFSLIAKLLERVAYTQSHSPPPPLLFLEPIPIRLLSLQAQGSQQHLMKVISFLEPLSSLDFLNPTFFRFQTHCLLFSILTY